MLAAVIAFTAAAFLVTQALPLKMPVIVNQPSML